MIENLTITGVKYDVNDVTQRYVTKKLGRLDRYLPRHARKSAAIDIKLKQVDQPNGNKYEAEAILTVPEKVLTAKDSTMNVLAAVDIVEAKLVSQLRKYKDAHVAHHGKSRSVLARLKRSYQRDAQ